ncbi:hypothetical protein Aduo_018751 [Ancylostoma duodenale]
MSLLPPCDFLADALHVCSEGIARDRMRDLFSSKTKFPGLRPNTFLGRMKTCKAAELDELAFVVFPLVVAVGIVPCPSNCIARILDVHKNHLQVSYFKGIIS